MVHAALAEKTAVAAHGPWSHLDGIQHWRSRLEASEPPGRIKAWSTPEGLLIEDGSHRTCAMYELAWSEFELQVEVRPAVQAAGLEDLLPDLREYA